MTFFSFARLIMYCFVDDIFMVPDDPFGRYGPPLNRLLTIPKPRRYSIYYFLSFMIIAFNLELITFKLISLFNQDSQAIRITDPLT